MRQKQNNDIVLTFSKHRKRIDLLIANRLSKSILKHKREKKVNNIMLNMEGINFIDSTSFTIFLEVFEKLKQTDKTLYFTNVSEELKELIHFMRMDNKFYIINSHERKSPTQVA